MGSRGFRGCSGSMGTWYMFPSVARVPRTIVLSVGTIVRWLSVLVASVGSPPVGIVPWMIGPAPLEVRGADAVVAAALARLNETVTRLTGSQPGPGNGYAVHDAME